MRAPYGGRGEILVQAGLKDDVVLVEDLLRGMHLRIDSAERRSAIAGDEACRIVRAGLAVTLLLHEKEPNDRLRAGREHTLFRQVELVVEGNALERVGQCRGFGLYANGRVFRHTINGIIHGVTSQTARH